MKISPLTGVTFTAAILALSTGGWVRNSALSVGVVTGGVVCYQLRPRRNQLSDAEVLELAILSATAQAESEINSLEKSLLLKNQQLTEISQLSQSELDAIATERQQHIQNLNNQIDELTQLLDDQLAEIDQREEESRQRLQSEMEEYKQAVEAQLEQKRHELSSIATEDEQWLNQETDRLTQALEEDKRIFLEKHKSECDRLYDRIDFLEQELGALQWQLRNYEQPQLPEGVEQDAIASRRVIEILDKLGVTCDYRGSWLDTSYIYVRIRPRTGGIKQINKWLDRLQIELALAEKPQAELVPGAIQLFLKPRTFLSVEPDSVRVVPAAHSHPEVVEEGAIATLNASYLRDFVEPEVKHSINGAISQLEIDWFNFLWNFHEPRPIRNQKAIIFRIWGKKSGDGAGFQTARGRLHRIAQILKIELRKQQ